MSTQPDPPPITQPGPQGPVLAPSPRARRGWRLLGGAVLWGVLGLIVLVGVALWYARTPSFANFARNKLVTVLGDATGGRVELAGFRWHPLRLDAEVDGLTIHGLEAPSEVPYLHVDRLEVQAKIIDLFKAQVGLRLLDVDHPVFHLIFYPNGTTNQPEPKTKSKSNKPVTDTIFDLAVDRANVNRGVLLLNQRAIPFDVAANNLGVLVTYRAKPENYLATLHVEDLTAQRGKAPAVRSALDLNVEMARNALKLDGLHFASGASKLDASGVLNDFTAQHWNIGANGTVDLRAVAALAGVVGLGPGELGLQIQGQGVAAKTFDVGGKLAVRNATYRTPSLVLSGLNVTTSLRATQDVVTLPDLKVRLRQGGGIDADAKVVNYMPAAAPAAAPGTTPTSAAPARRITARTPQVPQQQANIHARVFGIQPTTVFEIIDLQKYDNLGFDTQVDGTADIAWKGSAADLVASTNLALAPPYPPTPNEVPVRGVVDASYAARGGKLEARQVELHTPASFVGASGTASFSPRTGPTTLKVDLTTSNLNEFDRALIAFGVQSKGKKGVAAIPVQLHGEAGFHGTVTGSLEAPDVRGHASAKDFATVIETQVPVPPPPQPRTPVSARPPHPPPPSQGTQQTVQWDDLELDAEYNPAMVSVSNLSLTRAKTAIHANGQLHAVRTRRGKYLFNNHATLAADARINNASVTDLMSIAGESLPVTGTVNLQAHAGGALDKLNGGGHLSVLGGAIYGEPYKSLDTDLRFAGETVGISNLALLQDGGRLTGDADYNLTAKSLRANVLGAGFDLAHIQKLQGKTALGGALSFDLHATGTAESPQVNGKLALVHILVNQQAVGDINAEVHTTGHTAFLDSNAAVAQAKLAVNGRVDLTGNYPMQAKLTFAQLNFAPVLQLLDVNGVKGSSDLAGVVTVAGPAKTPKQLHGTAEIQQFRVTLENMPLTSKGPIRASLNNGVVRLDQLEIDAEDTSLRAGGTADVLGDGGVDAQMQGNVNARLAQSFSPQITSSGHVSFDLTALGALKKPDLEGQFEFKDVNFAYQQIPNGISHLNGAMVFNQDRLELRNMVATTGGGQVQLGGFLIYQQGVYADLTAALKNTRFRYAGLSTTTDSNLRLQGSQNSLQLSGNVLITRFLLGQNVDFAALGGSNAVAPPPDPNAFGNKLRLDVHITSSPQMDFQNSFAQIAGSVNLRIRGTAAQPAVLGRINITDGKATYNGTTYQLQHGDIYFTNPVHIEPVIDLDATTRIEEYDVTIGLHGTASKLTPTFRSEPPLPEADVISLLAQGRTQEEQSIYSSQQQAAGVNGTTNALLSGALNATVSNRIQKLFGVGSVKIDPTYTGSLGQSSARITVTQNIGQQVLLTYATSVNSTTQQLISAQFNLSPTFSVTAVRDEADVFSLLFKIHRRYR